VAREMPVVIHKFGRAWSNLVKEYIYELGYNNVYENAKALQSY